MRARKSHRVKHDRTLPPCGLDLGVNRIIGNKSPLNEHFNRRMKQNLSLLDAHWLDPRGFLMDSKGGPTGKGLENGPTSCCPSDRSFDARKRHVWLMLFDLPRAEAKRCYFMWKQIHVVLVTTDGWKERVGPSEAQGCQADLTRRYIEANRAANWCAQAQLFGLLVRAAWDTWPG